MKQFTPAIYNYSNPVGLDQQIAYIQSKLARINFMEVIFGRANIQSRLTDKGKRIFYPQGRQMEKDIDFSFNDTYASSVFFLNRNPINASPNTNQQDWTEGNVELSQPISIIFFGNTSKLECSSTEIIKTCLLFELGKCATVKISNLYENCADVWKDFTMTDEMSQFTKYPYYAIRIDITVTYMAMPFNGNGYFNPATYDLPNNESIQPNTVVNQPNLN
jgi:hypothetical protein